MTEKAPVDIIAMMVGSSAQAILHVLLRSLDFTLNGCAGGEDPGSADACGQEVRAGADGYVWCPVSPGSHVRAGGARHGNVRNDVPYLRARGERLRG